MNKKFVYQVGNNNKVMFSLTCAQNHILFRHSNGYYWNVMETTTMQHCINATNYIALNMFVNILSV